ncbi:MAG: carbon-phosphorus lyase complex subunit PhnI [Actinomycetota bacterium]|nr:carbon-phosphorus lyase complex subunit PhnI [Actinomycetota bacterium]
MGYVAARGGLDAIKAAEDLVRRKRTEGDSAGLGLDQLVDRQRLAVDRVMGEGGLWDPETAARALRQAEGDPIEAAHLVRAYRSTLPRVAYTPPTATSQLRILRRIVPAFRTPPGPQLLGRTTDYAGRLLDLPGRSDAAGGVVVDDGTDSSGEGRARATVAAGNGPPPATAESAVDEEAARGVERRPPRLYELLRKMDLVVERRTGADADPFDITRTPPRPGAPRSARLAAMARAETGALVQLWYRNILGPDNHLHEVTLGEVRHGHLPVRVDHPHTGRPVTVGEIRVTEVEAIEDLDGPDEETDRFDVGYGMVMGHNERKAIAMANLDIAVHRDRGRSPLEQSILQTTDGLDASGFLEHLKLPHYVTFRSMVERKHARRTADPVTAGVPDDAEIEVECR